MPSREGIGDYQALRSELNELVGEINGDLATAHWTPIVYLHQGVSREELAALYSLADIAWVTPLRDGLESGGERVLRSASRDWQWRPGAGANLQGAAAEMGEALLVNPYNEDSVAETIVRALRMDESERQGRMNPIRATAWCGNQTYSVLG